MMPPQTPSTAALRPRRSTQNVTLLFFMVKLLCGARERVGALWIGRHATSFATAVAQPLDQLGREFERVGHGRVEIGAVRTSGRELGEVYLAEALCCASILTVASPISPPRR